MTRSFELSHSTLHSHCMTISDFSKSISNYDEERKTNDLGYILTNLRADILFWILFVLTWVTSKVEEYDVWIWIRMTLVFAIRIFIPINWSKIYPVEEERGKMTYEYLHWAEQVFANIQNRIAIEPRILYRRDGYNEILAVGFTVNVRNYSFL